MARKSDSLSTYRAKRDFSKTAEPPPDGDKLPWGDGNGFMVQKHDATRLHFDLRLELDGTLKSWAVPNGPSLDPADKRLAIRTEDHPLGYASFEGTIPEGEYGGGTVMMWDRGTWQPAPGKDPRRSLNKGHLHFRVDGERMKGEWILIRMSPRPGDKKENWILRKIEDEHAGNPTGLTDKHLTSIKTGRTMQEIAAGKKASQLASWRRKPRPNAASLWRDSAPRSSSSDGHRKEGSGPRRKGSTQRTRLPSFREPQKATLVDQIPAGSGWIHEMKYDGYRCLLAIATDQVRIYTRKGLDWTDKFPQIAEAARRLKLGSALLDGEIVSVDAKGKTGFSALQQAIGGGGRGLTLFLFDAIEVDGEDLTSLGTTERKARLKALIGDGRPPYIHFADHIVGHGEPLYDAMCKAGQEGIISKRADASYRSGRSRAWLKIKCINRQEFIVIGWTPSDKKGRGFRSLLLAVHEGKKLRYVGKVGTGFSIATIHDLRARMEPLEVDKPPTAVPRADARGAHWLKPELVAEIAYGEFTSEGILRHPSFLGLREDKPAAEVVVEKPQPAPKVSAVSTAAPGDEVKISNPGRVIYPEAKITKIQLVDYFRAVAPFMLPFAANRPLTLVRCPQGRAKKCFYQKHDAGTFGPRVYRIPIEEKKGEVEDYLYFKDRPGLVTCVQMGVIEFHGWGSRIEDVEKPDRLVFDIDPDEGLAFDRVRRAARDLRRHLADIGLQSFAMLTGGKGVHVIVPLKPKAEWPAVKDFAHRFAMALATAEPDRFTANLSKSSRKGRMFLDYLRNQRGSTAILPYSARAREGAPVAAPIHWDELEGMESGARFTLRDVDALVERAGSRRLQGWGEADQVLPDL